jgi:predicted sulfurtransferase
LRDAIALTGLCSGIALAVNLVHPEGIPYVADKPYEVLVPCPVAGGAATPLKAAEANLDAPRTFVVDARSAEAFAAKRFGAATNISYDYLDPTPPEVMAKTAKAIAQSGAARVVVYGDGDTPDTGEELAKELVHAGINNVFFVRGGARALERLQAGGTP